MFFVSNALFALCCVISAVLFVDMSMHYLRGNEDAWLIPLAKGQVDFQFIALILCGGVGYTLGYNLGMSLPNHNREETIVISCVFSLIASMVCRGYVVLHFHKISSLSNVSYR